MKTVHMVRLTSYLDKEAIKFFKGTGSTEGKKLICRMEGRVHAWCERNDIKVKTNIVDEGRDINVIFDNNESLVAFKLGFE